MNDDVVPDVLFLFRVSQVLEDLTSHGTMEQRVVVLVPDGVVQRRSGRGCGRREERRQSRLRRERGAERGCESTRISPECMPSKQPSVQVRLAEEGQPRSRTDSTYGDERSVSDEQDGAEREANGRATHDNRSSLPIELISFLQTSDRRSWRCAVLANCQA